MDRTDRSAGVWLVAADVAYLDYVSGKKSPLAVDCGMAKNMAKGDLVKMKVWNLKMVLIIAGKIAEGGIKVIPDTHLLLNQPPPALFISKLH